MIIDFFVGHFFKISIRKIAISPLKICIFNFRNNEGFIQSILQYSLTVIAFELYFFYLNYGNNGLKRIHSVSNKNIISFID